MNSQWLKCKQFARACYETNKEEYARRNQNNKEMIISQIAQGKYAELLVQSVLTEEGYDIINEVDFAIYHTKDKSFDCDIRAFKEKSESNVWDFHVKSISKKSADRYGASWLFQKRDPLLTTPKSNDKVVFVLLDEQNISYKEIVCIDARELHRYLKSPKKESLRGNKYAVYMEDLLI